jgi:protein-S-isoprenylcysteine O-methyltransferase Ste14
MQERDLSERPNHLPWPPMLYATAIGAALLANGVWPLGFGLPWPWRGVGLGILGAGLGLDLLAIFTLVRHRTTFRPDRGTSRLVTSGPYAFSRNPIYLGNAIALGGLALVLDTAWLLLSVPVVSAAVQKLAIEREERHLAAVFGGGWEAYRRRVRRWV